MNRPTDSVRLALFDRESISEFLILTEIDDPDNWKLTGGKFDTATETPWDAMSRELHEELRLDPVTVRLKHAGYLANNDGISARHVFFGLMYRNQLAPSEQISRILWAHDATIPEAQNKDHIVSAVRLARTALHQY